MRPDVDEIEAKLTERIGVDALSAIEESRKRSNQILAQSKQLIGETLEEGKQEIPNGIGLGWVAVGSVGRFEATEGSDIDLILVYDASERPDEDLRKVVDQVTQVDQAIRASLRNELVDVDGVSKGEHLTSPVSVQELRDSAKVGGRQESVRDLTKRTLVLTESRGIYSTDARDIRGDARRAVLDVFQRKSKTRGKNLLSLINDLTRYYRTLCVDYKSRVDYEAKPWGIRNLKLRHSKKTWFFSTALAVVSVTADREYAGDEQEKLVEQLLDISPTYRLAYALIAAGLESQLSVLRVYDRFLEFLGEKGVRDSLQTVKHSKRYDNEQFRILKDNSDHLHERYLDIVDALPPHWRRHLLSHFLL